MSCGEIVGEAIRARAKVLGEREPAARSGADIEAVHDMRVASRRLCAALAVGEAGACGGRGAERVAKAARRVRRALGAPREWDVHAETLGVLEATARDDLERAAIEHALEWVDARRAKKRKRMLKALDRIDVPRLVGRAKSLARRLREDAGAGAGDGGGDGNGDGDGAGGGGSALAPTALAILEPRAVAAFEARPDVEAGEPPEALHAFRIALKKLRYALELFEPAFREGHDVLLARIKALQEILGRHRDRVVLADILGDRRARLEALGREALATGLSRAIDRLAAERRNLFLELGDRLQGFTRDAFLTDCRRGLGLEAGAPAPAPAPDADAQP